MASATQPSPSPRRSRFPWLRTVRARVIAAVFALTALALTIAGFTAYSLETAKAELRVEGYLERAVDEFRVLACGQSADCTPGVDPTTGRPFANADDLIRVAMQRQVLAANEGELGIIGGKVRLAAPDGVTFRPEHDPEFVNTVLPLSELDHVTRGRLTTPMADYSYAVIPVRFPNERGALVQTFDMRAEHDLLRATYGTYALVALGSLAVVGFLIWLLVGRLLQPIRLLRTAAEDITEHDLSRRIPVHGNDDLSALTRTVNAMLDRLNAAMGSQRQLLDDVGHELRTPVTIVRGHLELMDAADADDVRATRALALDELDRMGRLVDDLLTLAKAERSDFIQPQPTDIGRLTDETLEKARGLAPRRWLLDDLADVEASLDPQRVTQAWLQLASNAVKYSPAETPIALGSAVRRGELWLWVRDQGVGISPDERDIVLARFGRGADAPLRADGAGLGLAIVDKIVTAHGGRVDIESVVGRGSTIALILPLQPTPTPLEASAMSQILIIEDEPRIAAFVAKGLKSAGYSAHIESSGIIGAQLAVSDDFDLVILDVGLPDIDGFEVLNRLRGQGVSVPVIMLTARSSVTDTVAGLEGGADDYMAKPFSFEELLARVRLRLRADTGAAASSTILTHRDLSLDLRTRRATVDGREVDLSAREFTLAEAFLTNPGQVLSREQLLSSVWGYDFDPGSNVVDVYVRYLRRKLGAERFETVRGMGYRLV